MPPPKKGLSTGVKIAIGCGALLLLVLIVVATCTMIVGKKIKDAGVAIEDQQAAQAKVQELEREHPFTPPADGALAEDRVETFFAVADDAWRQMGDWVEEMEERGERIDRGEGGFGDAVAGVRGLAGLADARLALVEAFDEHDMPPSEFVWTGFQLVRAHEAGSSGSAAGVPPQNVEIAERHSAEIAELAEGEDGKRGKQALLGLAFTLYPSAAAILPPRADTLMQVPK